MKAALLAALLLQVPLPKYRADLRKEGEKIVLKNVGTMSWAHPIVEVNFHYKLAVAEVAPGTEVSFTKGQLKDWEGNAPGKDVKIQTIQVRTDKGTIDVLP